MTRNIPSLEDYDYYRELPEPYPPAEAAVLIRYKKLTPDDITATIMDLARREYLIIEEAAGLTLSIRAAASLQQRGAGDHRDRQTAGGLGRA